MREILVGASTSLLFLGFSFIIFNSATIDFSRGVLAGNPCETVVKFTSTSELGRALQRESDAFSSYDYDDSSDAKSGIACWDVSLIKDFGRAFESLQPDYCWGCSDDDLGRFTGDISKWDVSQGTLTSDTILT